MGLLDYFDPDQLRGKLKGLLGGMPLTQALRGELEVNMPTRAGLKSGLMGIKPFQNDPAQNERVMMEAMNTITPMGLFGVIKKAGNIAKYQGPHTPAGKDYGAPLHDLTKLYPDDVYSPQGLRYYASNGSPGEARDFYTATSYRGKPDAPVTIYRAVPYEPTPQEAAAALEKQMAAYMRRGKAPDGSTGAAGSEWYNKVHAELQSLKSAPVKEPEVFDINPGDWVALSREYAKGHGESALGGKYKIVSRKAKAKELFNSADSIQEYGWWPD